MILILDILTTTMVKIGFFFIGNILYEEAVMGNRYKLTWFLSKTLMIFRMHVGKVFFLLPRFVLFLFPKWMWKKLFCSLTWLEARNLSSYYRFYGSVRYNNFFFCLPYHNLIPNTSTHTQQLASKKTCHVRHRFI